MWKYKYIVLKTRVAGRFLARLFRNLHNYARGITIGRKGKGRECNDLGGCEIGPAEDGHERRARKEWGKVRPWQNFSVAISVYRRIRFGIRRKFEVSCIPRGLDQSREGITSFGWFVNCSLPPNENVIFTLPPIGFDSAANWILIVNPLRRKGCD